MKKLLAISLLAVLSLPAQNEATFNGVARVVAIGDIHGDDGRLEELLRTAALIDANGKWSGGAAHLVLVGDFLDRGPDSRKVMDRLMALEPQAAAAGGHLHALIGNHEAMNLQGDLRYVSKEDALEFLAPGAKGDGQKERRDALGPKGVYGQWLRKQNAIVKINDGIFLHAGIGPGYANDSIEKINKEVRKEIEGTSARRSGYTVDQDGPLWYRGFVMDPEDNSATSALLDRVLATHGAKRIVVGHSIVPVLLPRFGGKVLAIDNGLSSFYGDGPGAFLVIENGKYFAYHRGHKLELPEPGAEIGRYLATAANLDPPDSALRKALQPKR